MNVRVSSNTSIFRGSLQNLLLLLPLSCLAWEIFDSNCLFLIIILKKTPLEIQFNNFKIKINLNEYLKCLRFYTAISLFYENIDNVNTANSDFFFKF